MRRSHLLRLIASVVLASFAAAGTQGTDVLNLAHQPVNPFAAPHRVRVLLFARTDCPITKRYAPELHRIAQQFQRSAVDFWLVFPDRAETAAAIGNTIAEYHFPGTPLLDPKHVLVKFAHATVAPEAAVFDQSDTLIYHGRIDDRYVDIGKAKPSADVHDLENAITAALAHKKVAEPVTRAVGCSLADIE